MTDHGLIVIDMLNDFLDQWPVKDCSTLIKHTNALVACFRNKSLPIIWVRQEFKADLSDAFLEMRDKDIAITIEGSRGAKIHEELDRHSSDLVITKKRYSAFFGTNLEAVLKEKAISQITLAGVNTHACIRMAAIDAYQRDMRVIIAGDCVDTRDEEHGRISLRYMANKIAQIKTNEQIFAEMEA